MSNRELLELAAKAAGYAVVWNENWQCFMHRNPTPDAHGVMRHPWTPDADDGDALRLAVKMELGPLISSNFVYVKRYYDDTPILREPLGTDSYAATRHAIVRAAAEIGKAMP